jgi:HEAT repeat protein
MNTEEFLNNKKIIVLDIIQILAKVDKLLSILNFLTLDKFDCYLSILMVLYLYFDDNKNILKYF